MTFQVCNASIRPIADFYRFLILFECVQDGNESLSVTIIDKFCTFDLTEVHIESLKFLKEIPWNFKES